MLKIECVKCRNRKFSVLIGNYLHIHTEYLILTHNAANLLYRGLDGWVGENPNDRRVEHYG